ncbi:MAG: Fe(2+)-trafficking protein [Planctomycetota bacterium]
MDLEQRIAQFEKMAHDDPDNDMAHFSLGGAYNQAGRFADAAASYRRCFELNPAMSKAYQLCGAALMATGDEDGAAEVMTEGYTVAAERGDLLPKNAMGELLEQLGRPVPEVEEKAAEPLPDGSFICGRTGKPGTKMERPPFRGPVGAWIAEHVSQEAFNDWLAQGTKVINELRLDMSRDEDAATYDQHMHEYLGIDDDVLASLQK